MKPKNLIPLVVVLAILVALFAYKKSTQRTPGIIEQTRLVTLAPEGMSKSDIVKMDLCAGAKPDEKLTLAFDSGADKWRVTTHFNAPVKKDTIDKYLDAIVKLKGEPRETTTSESGLEQYNLSDAKAFHLIGYKKDSTEPFFHLLIGKSPGYKSVFMRKAGDNQVFVEETNLRQMAGIYDDSASRPGAKKEEKEPEVKKPEATAWLDKEICKIDTAKAAKLAVNTPDKALVFERREKPKPQEPAAPEAATPPAAPAPAPAAIPAPAPAPAPEAAPAPAAPAPAAAPAPSATSAPPLTATPAPPPAPAPAATPAPAPAAEEAKPSGSSEAEENDANISVQPMMPPAMGAPAESKPQYEWALASGGAGLKLKEKSIDTLLQRFANLNATDVVDPAKKAEWGLETPAYKCTISIEEQPDIVIEGGRPNSSGDGYVRIAGTKEEIVYQVSKYTFEQIFPKGSELFDMPNVAVDKKNIESVQINQPEGEILLSKSDDKWNVAVPASDLKAQTSTVDGIVAGLSQWKASDYADADPGLGDPKKAATFKVSGQTRTLKVYGDSKSFDGVYARLDDNPAILAMSRIDANKIFPARKDLFDRTLADLSEEKIAEIHVTGPSASFSLARQDENWKLTVNGAASDGNPEACKELAEKVADLEAGDILFGQAELKAAVESTLKVKTTDGIESTYSFAAEKDGQHELKLTGKKEAFLVPHADVAALFPATDTLKKPEPPPPAPPAVVEVAPAPAPAPGPAVTTPAPPEPAVIIPPTPTEPIPPAPTTPPPSEPIPPASPSSTQQAAPVPPAPPPAPAPAPGPAVTTPAPPEPSVIVPPTPTQPIPPAPTTPPLSEPIPPASPSPTQQAVPVPPAPPPPATPAPAPETAPPPAVPAPATAPAQEPGNK
jgi:hypothetical protein